MLIFLTIFKRVCLLIGIKYILEEICLLLTHSIKGINQSRVAMIDLIFNIKIYKLKFQILYISFECLKNIIITQFHISCFCRKPVHLYKRSNDNYLHSFDKFERSLTFHDCDHILEIGKNFATSPHIQWLHHLLGNDETQSGPDRGLSSSTIVGLHVPRAAGDNRTVTKEKEEKKKIIKTSRKGDQERCRDD